MIDTMWASASELPPVAPLQWFPRLLHATAKLCAKWELIGDGIGIHRPLADEDLKMASLLAG